MNLAPMRYKNFTWPYNPEDCSVNWERKVLVHKVPFGTVLAQDVGLTVRTFRGEGTFTGTDAYRRFRKLEEVFRQEGAGLLTHPVWGTVRAWFCELELTEQPLPDYVRYRFTFREDGSTGKGFTKVTLEPSTASVAAPDAEAVYYTVRKGDTLWAIAKRYGVALSELIGRNPQIRNPNLIYPGDRVRIR